MFEGLPQKREDNFYKNAIDKINANYNMKS